MTIVNLEVRRRVKAEELLVEAQCLLLDLGHPDVAQIIRQACRLLTTPPEPPSAGQLRLVKNAA